jgi:hypothetical protein
MSLREGAPLVWTVAVPSLDEGSRDPGAAGCFSYPLAIRRAILLLA